jgi:quinol monooxygenase YgiN
MSCDLLLSSLPGPTIAYQQICWGGASYIIKTLQVTLSNACVQNQEEKMIVVRFKAKCKPEKAEQLRAAFEAVVAEGRTVPGCLNFDIARDVTDSNAFIATEVFADKEALARQEALPQANITPYGRTLGTPTLASGTSARRG